MRGIRDRTESSRFRSATIARINYNNAAGATGVALAPTDTTINFSAAPPFATVAAPNYVKLVLDPPIGPTPNPSFEIVYLTAYTAGQTTGTIQRGQETTSGVAHNAGATWACTPTVYDLQGQPPVGAVVPYAGTGDPPETNWVIADGRLIDRTVYADFFNRSSHSYNGGVDPGSNKVRIPDKRGKKSVGAINMGTGAGLADNAHFQAVRGTSYGEVNHTLLAAESGQNGNAGMGTESADHSHYTSGNTGYISADHGHSPAGGEGWWTNGGTGSTQGGQGVNAIKWYEYNTTGVSANHYHSWGAQSGGRSAAHSHAMTARNADSVHNNVDPCEADSYIVRIA